MVALNFTATFQLRSGSEKAKVHSDEASRKAFDLIDHKLLMAEIV